MIPLNKRQIIALVGLIIIVGIVIFLAVQGFNKSPTNSVKIQDFEKRVKNLPDQYRDSLAKMLYSVIKLNSVDGKTTETITSINDAIIRKDSERQEVVVDNRQFAGSFIVDIESIRQSYRVQYEYSTDPNDGFMSGYPLLISCLSKDELIYGDFNCKNTYSQNSNNEDPLVGNLPYDSLNFKIRALTSSDGKIGLEITLILSDADRTGDVNQIVETYKQEALNWISSRGYDPTKYTISYIY